VVRLMDLAHIRIGNEEYAQQNKSFGLTTMRNRHVKVKGSKILFHFRGKSGQDHSLVLEDKRLAAIVKRCRDLPGYELFQYVDARGDHISIDSGMVNDYLREISGEDITAKDFRTWHGTVHAATLLGDCATGECSDAELKRNVVAAVKEVAKKLGNRPATCRKYYIHPLVLEAYEKGTLTLVRGGRSIHLSPQEQAVMKLLEEKPKQAKRIAELAAAA
jgi:DNA topoisomerase-1